MHIKPKTTINTQMYKDAAQGKQLMWDKEVLQKTTADCHDLWMYSIITLTCKGHYHHFTDE